MRICLCYGLRGEKMGRFAAIGGGTFEETDELVRRIVEMSGKAIPNILYIGTAAEDSTNPQTSCKKSFKRVCRGTVMRKLALVRSSYTEEEMDALLNWADIIYVSGGNTEYMLEVWEQFGLDRKLKRIFEEDSAVLSGMSAGAICWFTDGYTDSDRYKDEEGWNFRLIRPSTGVYPALFCPHYNLPGRERFDEIARSFDLPAIALTDCAAFLYDNGAVSYAFSAPEAYAAEFVREGGNVTKILHKP